MNMKKCAAVFLAAVSLAASLAACAAPSSSEGMAVYPASEAYIRDGSMIFTVFADSTGEYLLDFSGDSDAAETELLINGISAGSVSIPSTGNSLTLHKGSNTVQLAYADVIESLTVNDASARAVRGATTPYTTFEAEDCTTSGTILEDTRAFHEIASEASGRQAVRLDQTGQSVSFKLTGGANALTLRTCVPDHEAGAGTDYTLTVTVGGDVYQAAVTSRYTWVYGDFPFTNTPDEATAHNFFDDVSFMLDKIYPAGTEVKVSKEAADEAPYYVIDLIETELAEPAFEQPENALSITDFGAAADDGKDDTQALLSCIDAAVKDGKEVWIPAGVFHFTSDKITIRANGVTIRGAGMWHTVLTGEGAAFMALGNDTAFYDFKMDGMAVIRRDDVDPAAFESDYGDRAQKNLTIQNIWVEHFKVGVWTYTISGVHLVGSRIRNTFADGINLCRASVNSMVEQCSFRGTGDDSVAMWSQTYADVNNIVRYNTISAPGLANGVAIYGGEDITICDNLISDTITEGSGINLSTNFDPADFGGTVLVERNTLSRCGSLNDQSGSKLGAVWFNTQSGHDNHAQVIVRDNTITDSSYQGLSFSGIATVDDVLIESNTIANSGTWGVEFSSVARGGAVLCNNRIYGGMEGQINTNNGQFFSVTEDGTLAEPAR